MQTTTITLRAPYLVFIGDIDSLVYAKTGAGLVQWCPQLVAGQLRYEGNRLDLGLQDLTLRDAVHKGIRSLVIGVAPMGGRIPEHWFDTLCEAAELGMDIVSGLHLTLSDYPALVEKSRVSGSQLIDVRRPPENLPVGNGIKRSGRRLLTVGTDCAVGKKYTALALTMALQASQIPATFRATGQTGIMIAGSGIPIDSVVSDFISGAAEAISPANDNAHWDVIEGQGSLFHPSYAGVSLGLLHGSQPDAIVVCHDPVREHIAGCPSFPVPTVAQCIEENMRQGALTNSNVKCIGVSVNTSKMASDEREAFLHALSDSVGLPCVDPIVDGCAALVEQLKRLD